MDTSQPITIAFLARSLETGGAERQLVNLAAGLDRRRFCPVVLCFYARGPLLHELEAAGVTVVDLAKSGRWDVLPFMLRLLRALRRLQPQLLHGYLPVPNILAGVSGLFLPGTRIIFGVRSAVMDLARYDWLFRLTYRAERWFTSLADRIIVNSRAGRQYYIDLGFPAHKMVVIPNGIDVAAFNPDAAGGTALRAAWGVPPDTSLIGLVARLDAMKGHAEFLEAAACLLQSHSSTRFVCVGGGPEQTLVELQEKALASGIAASVIWAGPHQDMPAVYTALDVACSASSGEGFPNAVDEAMACGVPCAVTDVGDSAFLVGETGAIAPPRDPAALANALKTLLDLPPGERRALGCAARQRIVACCSLDAMLASTQDELEAVLSGDGREGE